MLDALTNLKLEFETERPRLRELEEHSETKVVYTEQVRSMRKHAIACLITVFVLGCLYIAWDEWRLSKLQRNIEKVVELHTDKSPANFDKFYGDFQKAGGAAKLKKVSK